MRIWAARLSSHSEKGIPSRHDASNIRENTIDIPVGKASRHLLVFRAKSLKPPLEKFVQVYIQPHGRRGASEHNGSMQIAFERAWPDPFLQQWITALNDLSGILIKISMSPSYNIHRSHSRLRCKVSRTTLVSEAV